MNCQYVGKMEALLTLITDKLQKLDEHDRSLGYLLSRLERQATIFDDFADACERMEQVIRENKRPDILTVKRMASEVNVHATTIIRWYKEGRITGFRMSDQGHIYFDRDQALAELKHGKESEPGRPA